MPWRHAAGLIVSVAAGVLVAAGASVSAQDNPTETVQAQYDAFSAAYQTGDLAGAELAARSALDAHAAADLNDASRAVLLINLAIVLVESRQGVAAQGVLEQLAGLPAETYADAGALAQVLRAGADYWAEYTADPQSGPTLIAALQAAPTGQPMLSRQALPLAQTVAEQAQAARNFALAAAAWAQAARFSEAAGQAAPLMHGRALTGQGVALLFSDQDAAALNAFTQAMDVIAPFTTEASGEAAYAEAMAWRGAARAKMVSAGQDLTAFADPRPPAALSEAQPLCALRITADPQPETPQLRGGRVSVGAVVIAVSLAPDGRTTAAEIAAFAPDPALADNVRRVLPRWRFEVSPTAAAGCRVERERELRLIVLRGDPGGRS